MLKEKVEPIENQHDTLTPIHCTAWASMRVQLKKITGFALITGITIGSQIAQAQRLPPPPNVPPLPTAPLPAPDLPQQVPINVSPNPNERVFTAPQVDPIVTPAQRRDGFRVYVNSDSPYLLQRVRLIQPDAFIQNFGGRRVIQAGLFNDQFKARQQVSRLASQGIDAQITSGLPGAGSSQRGYFAVIPGNQFQVQNYRDRAIRLGVSQSLLQVRDRPRGLHLAVGPFRNQAEAEQAVRYLRDRGSLDARLFYDR